MPKMIHPIEVQGKRRCITKLTDEELESFLAMMQRYGGDVNELVRILIRALRTPPKVKKK